ncbi:MAG: hypothetical protein HUK12_07070 [Muribaculaceae bacterium]|nr:hypothetical protein [Muribaculaceae bacterium]
MDSYKSKTVCIAAKADVVYLKLTSPTLLQEKFEKLPPEYKEKVKNVTFTPDSVAFSIDPVGEIKLLISEKVPCKKIVYAPAAAPVQFNITINLEDNSLDTTNAVVCLNADIPFFIKPMLGGKLQDGVERFADLLTKIPFNAI